MHLVLNREFLICWGSSMAPIGAGRNPRTVTVMMTEEATYNMAQAARILHCSPWTLRDRVTRGEVPHHRSGRVKGVYFTEEDLLQIKAEHARPAVAPVKPKGRGIRTPAVPVPVTVIPEEFARLKRAQ